MKALIVSIILYILIVVNICLAKEYVASSYRVLNATAAVDWEEETFSEVVTWMREYVGWDVVVIMIGKMRFFLKK